MRLGFIYFIPIKEYLSGGVVQSILSSTGM